MKRITILFAFASALLLSSCGVNTSIIVNSNQNATQVQLGQDNFRVIGQVTGTAEVSYICAIGGLRKKRLYENAYSDMMKKAELVGGSRALINIVTEEHLGGVPPFFYKRTVTVSAHVIEFTE